MIEVELPDGTVLEFPDGTSQDVMRKAISNLQGSGYKASSDRDNARQVLEKLEAEGNLRPAEKTALDALRKSSAADTQEIGKTGATYRGAAQGATFNLSDEAAWLLGGSKAVAASREKNKAAQAAFPSEYKTGKTAGAIGSGTALGVATAPLSTGATALGTLARSGGLGLLEGGIWGAGAGEGLEDRAKKGWDSGKWGLLAGVAAPVAIGAGAKAARFVGDLAGGAAGVGNKARANRAVATAIRKSGKTGAELVSEVDDAARIGLPEYRLMDAMGTAGQRKASGIVRAGDDGADELAEFLAMRQAGQAERIAQAADDAFDMGGRTADDMAGLLRVGRKDAADTAYDLARQSAGPVDVRNAVALIDDRIGGMKGSNIAGDSIDGRLAGFRNRLAADPAPAGEISRELSDFDRVLGVKQDVQDAISAAQRAGRNNEARELTKLINELDGALEDASDAYRAANDGFAAASRPIDAIDAGKKMAMPRQRGDDTARIFGAMSGDQQAGARVGYGDTMLSRVEAQSAPTTNRAKLFASPKAQKEIDAIAVDPNAFKAKLSRENAMWETQNRALGGSRTADNLMDVENTTALADAARAARDVTSGNVGNAISNLAQGASRIASGENAATRKIVADILSSPNPQAQISKVLKQAKNSDVRRRISEAIFRAISRPMTETQTQQQ